jgi:hypothetical protein
MELTAAAARHYAAAGEHAIFPLRMALRVMTALSRSTIRMIDTIPGTRQRVTERAC